MAFKMSYSFEGNPKMKPEQNLSGSCRNLSRETLLQKTHEERRKRQEQRQKLLSTELLQSHVRSYLVRKQYKEEQRQSYDRINEYTCIQILLSKLLFFYDSHKDKIRLYKLSERILNERMNVLNDIEINQSFAWLIRRWLVLCLENFHDSKNMNLLISYLDNFVINIHTSEYLIRKGYYTYLRTLLDNNPKESIEQIIELINRPFHYLRLTENYDKDNSLMISELCSNFLKPTITNTIKLILLPYLKNKRDIPFEQIIRYLNNSFHYEISNSLFYCILALEPDNYEPTLDSIQVLSILSNNIYQLKQPIDLIRNDNDDSDDSDDDDDGDRDDDVSSNRMEISEEELLLSDFLYILNKTEKVRKWLQFYHNNNYNKDILICLTRLCHNLLLLYKDSIRKFLLLYKLGLNGDFLNKLWNLLNSNTRSLDVQIKGMSLMKWSDSHINLSVFCDMFTFYTETLTDRENSDTSETFSSLQLCIMSKLLKDAAIDLVEVAFPMCRSSAISASPKVLHLYNSCLKCLKMLYMLDMRKHFCPTLFWTARKIYIPLGLTRKNILSLTIQPFDGDHSNINNMADEDNLIPLSTLQQRSLALLQQLPFLIAFNTRVLLLRNLCKFGTGETEYGGVHSDFHSDIAIVIRRTHLYEDAFEKLSVKNESDLKRRVRILFINSVGLEEAGIDGGGIFKEFINELLKTAFDPNRGFFLLTADNTLYPNPNVHLIVENFTEHYYFIGRLVGKAIFENILVDLPLAEFFLAKLLVNRASAHYLKSLDPILYRNLMYLRDYSGDVSDLGLDFTTANNDLGETRVMELKPDGHNIPLTNDNRLEYIQKLADLKLNVQLKKQCNAFREGLDSVVPLLWLKLFNHNELQVIIGGDTQAMDYSDLRAHTVYGGEFTEDHPTIILFWKIVYKFTDVQQKQLLKFVTSCSRPPLLGFKELQPQFCIQSSGSEDRMPTASTCLNLLKIPVIKEEEILKNKLIAAIEQQAGFELS